jgi:hypothetical protein
VALHGNETDHRGRREMLGSGSPLRLLPIKTIKLNLSVTYHQVAAILIAAEGETVNGPG